MYGAEKYGELVTFLFRQFAVEETQTIKKIDELMQKLVRE